MSEGQLREFVNEPCESEHLDDYERRRLTDREPTQIVCETCRDLCEFLCNTDIHRKLPFIHFSHPDKIKRLGLLRLEK